MSLSTVTHIPNQPSAASIFAKYPRPDVVFDELMDHAGVIRPQWTSLTERIDAAGAEVLREKGASAQQLLKDHGVTYNVYADGRNDERPWKLDMLPLVIGAAEWARLERGLIQRTRLLNLILADIYGDQRMIREGLLPSALLHANPGFIRSCHGMRPAGERFLTLHA